ncbi:hypothetical protein [Streptomyces sp. NPDC005438]
MLWTDLDPRRSEASQERRRLRLMHERAGWLLAVAVLFSVAVAVWVR